VPTRTRTRYGTSPWIHELPSTRVAVYPRFRDSRTADVVIIGGGLTGAAIAHACAAARLDTVLLEAARVGQGATSRSSGLLPAEPGPQFREVVALHGLKNARRIFETWRRGAIDGAAVVRRLRINCQLQSRDTLVVERGPDEKTLRREFEARRDAGLDAAWQTSRQLRSRMKLETAAAIRLRDGFTLDPYRLCLGLMAAAARRGAKCFEQSAVKKVTFTRKHADVVLAQGTIRTGAVVVATGTATEAFKQLRRHLKERHTYCAMTEPVPAAMRKQLGDPAVVLRDHEAPYRVFWAPGDRLVLNGADQDAPPPRVQQEVVVQRTGQLMYQLLTMYPAISGLQPAYGWEAPYGIASDGLMYIGAHRNYPHHLFALGAPGGITGSFVAARLLLRAIQGKPDKADEVFGWTR
jgi:glycine/D-amino acid oxidase-like deaminating enzyme